MNKLDFHRLFTQERLEQLFPKDRSDRFFEALYGDSSEGAYDINLHFKEFSEKKLAFEFQLNRRAGKCLACNLTYGLPTVFTRHPVINIKQLIEKINHILPDGLKCTNWQIGNTSEKSTSRHVIPLTVSIGE